MRLLLHPCICWTSETLSCGDRRHTYREIRDDLDSGYRNHFSLFWRILSCLSCIRSCAACPGCVYPCRCCFPACQGFHRGAMTAVAVFAPSLQLVNSRVCPKFAGIQLTFPPKVKRKPLTYVHCKEGDSMLQTWASK